MSICEFDKHFRVNWDIRCCLQFHSKFLQEWERVSRQKPLRAPAVVPVKISVRYVNLILSWHEKMQTLSELSAMIFCFIKEISRDYTLILCHRGRRVLVKVVELVGCAPSEDFWIDLCYLWGIRFFLHGSLSVRAPYSIILFKLTRHIILYKNYISKSFLRRLKMRKDAYEYFIHE